MTKPKPRVCIVIPTLNAERYLPTLLERLKSQTLEPEQIQIVDSASRDNTPHLALQAGVSLRRIAKNEFDHGGTRNLGARAAKGADILVFMTQDALPTDEHWLERLTAPIVSGEAVATFSRQIPYPDAGLLEQFARNFNYPAESRLKTLEDLPQMGIKTFFFSNVCSAVSASHFWEVGGFPERTILNEDMMLAARLLRAGYAVKYVAEAPVYHSHNYSVRQQFTRNFDIGVSIARAGTELEGAKVGGEGLRFVLGQMRYVVAQGRPDLLGRVILESGAKFSAHMLGKREALLPRAFKQRLSMHSYFWDQEENI